MTEVKIGVVVGVVAFLVLPYQMESRSMMLALLLYNCVFAIVGIGLMEDALIFIKKKRRIRRFKKRREVNE